MPEPQDTDADINNNRSLDRRLPLPNQSKEFHHATSCAAEGICACHEVSDAYKLLHEAATTSIAIPPEVVSAINEAHALTYQKGSCENPYLETRFWNAYGLLSSIKPADRIITRYKWLFYIVLTVLLSLQVYYFVGSMVITRLTEVEKEWRQLTESKDNAGMGHTEQVGSQGKTVWDKLRRVGTAQANYDFARRLVPLFKAPPPMSQEFYSSLAELGMKNQKFVDSILANLKLKDELELNLMALNAYILPLFYGAWERSRSFLESYLIRQLS